LDFYDKQYVIGIDLGTTNSAVSYVDVTALNDDTSMGKKHREKKSLVKVFNVPQLTGHGEFTKNPVLPSFLYIPGKYDISKEVLKHPWKKRQDFFAGGFARDHGSKIPSRLVSSAKSWLCNDQADRRSKILPWGSEGFEKVSPVTATSEYLLHIRSAWNHFVKDEDKFIENQFVVITVPASFNESARDLTMEAVKKAGFASSVVLLEEPLAAFYSWLINHEDDWQNQVKADDLILVCDVGGGTTDFSLIVLKESEGTPRFERIAVGDHLILGGDNIDLALAKKVASKFKSGTQLSSDKWKTLCHRCREAKEKILDDKESSVRITIKGEGRSLISGTLAADLTRDEVEEILLNDFYPYVESKGGLTIDKGKEITDFGLPLEKESAVTRHIIQFLEHHKKNIQENLSKEPVPDFILFNGGTLKPSFAQERICKAIGKWFGSNESKFPQILENFNPELAVGLGASYYGLVKQGQGVRVGSGSPRSYYIGVSIKDEKTSKAVCVVERGLDEGSVIDLDQMKYEVRTNEPVSFDIYHSSYRSGDTAGSVVNVDDSFSSMAPIHTVIRFGKSGQKKIIPVTIGAEYTEMGTLSMYCNSGVSDHKWRLQFQLRDRQTDVGCEEAEVYDEHLIAEACHRIHEIFTDESDKDDALRTIVKKIEKTMLQKKKNWPLSFLRNIADKLIELEYTRKYSAAHEARWLNLTGFCMRPGFGDAFDKERIKKIWKIYLNGLIFEKIIQNRLEWLVFIRRTAAGLGAGQQRQLFQDMSPILIKDKNIRSKISPQEQIELWMALGNMERLLVKDKVALAKSLITLLKPGKKQDNLFWTFSRIGARELLYGSVDRVVAARQVIGWINQMMKKKWQQNDAIDAMIAQISRKTGDRTRDMEPADTIKITQWLEKRKAKASIVRMVNEKVDMAVKEKSVQFGEKLPPGIVLR